MIFKKPGLSLGAKILYATSSLSIVVMVIIGLKSFREANNSPYIKNKSNKTEPAMLWLNGDLCLPPCLMGVVPGTTTTKDATILIGENKHLVDSYAVGDSSFFLGEIYWDFHEIGGGRAFFDLPAENSLIKYILVDFGCCIFLENIIASFGNPSHILIEENITFHSINAEQYYYSYKIFWINQGFGVNGIPFVPDDGGAINIDENYLVRTIVFFAPSYTGLKSYLGERDHSFVPWHGYDTRDTYLSQ